MISCDVLAVGAGPTGLTLAIELRRRGVDVLLIDALEAPQHWDRATVVHPRSLEIFEALGIVDEFLAAGAPRLHSAGEAGAGDGLRRGRGGGQASGPWAGEGWRG